MPASALLDWANRTTEGSTYFQVSQAELNIKKETP
jgi:hypothetical protein